MDATTAYGNYADRDFARTLEGYYYHDSRIYDLELERIFLRQWVCAGRTEQATQPGTFFTIDIGFENVLVVRGKDGALRAFLNVCQHRGAQVCSQAQGRANSFQCPYHAWTYGTDGRLIGAPNVMADPRFDRSAHGLTPVACEEWLGFVWLNLSEQPGPLAAQIARALDQRGGDSGRVQRYGIERLRIGHTIVYDVRANWKLTIENFMECYHCGPMHPDLCRIVPSFRTGDSFDGGRFGDGVAAFSIDGQRRRPALPGLLPEDEGTYFGLPILPNVLLSMVPDHVVVDIAYPVAPDRTTVICHWLFDPEVMAQPGFDPMDAVELFDTVNREDWAMCELTQRGMRSRAYRDGGVYVPLENRIADFNRMVRESVESTS